MYTYGTWTWVRSHVRIFTQMFRYTYMYIYMCVQTRMCASDSLAIEAGEDWKEKRRKRRQAGKNEREATVMDRPISAARWSTRETERVRKRDQERIFSTYGMVRGERWKKRERGRATERERERERSWSGRSLANRRTRGGPVAVPRERNSTSAILLCHHLSLDRLLCNLLSTKQRILFRETDSRDLEFPWYRSIKFQLIHIYALRTFYFRLFLRNPPFHAYIFYFILHHFILFLFRCPIILYWLVYFFH